MSDSIPKITPSCLPYPPRFRTWADAELFLKTGDDELKIPVFVKVDEKIMWNKEYDDARFEINYIWHARATQEIAFYDHPTP